MGDIGAAHMYGHGMVWLQFEAMDCPLLTTGESSVSLLRKKLLREVQNNNEIIGHEI